jgi:WhiB family transcriptional regulator, redox-sensing transcriptional regulator
MDATTQPSTDRVTPKISTQSSAINNFNKPFTAQSNNSITEHQTIEQRKPQEKVMFTQILDHKTPEWFIGARCADGVGTLTSLFFSEDLSEIARAKAICGNCTERESCLMAAVSRREPWGVWGGELVMNGKVLSAQRRRGRPPKHARPELVIDELGAVISA